MVTCPWGRSNINLSKVATFTKEQRYWFGMVISTKKQTISQLRDRFQLKDIKWRRKLSRMAEDYRKGMERQERRGRPNLLSPEGERRVLSKIAEGIYKTSYDEWVKDVNAEVNQGLKPQDEPFQISTRSLKRLEQKLGVHSGNAEVTTNARFFAERSKRI